MRRVHWLVLTLFLGGSLTALAHHAPALYDNDRLLRIKGTLERRSFRFPHSELILVLPSGERWAVNLAPPDVSERKGTKAMIMALEKGQTLQVIGWPHRLGKRELRSHKVILADGTVLEGAFNTLYEPPAQKRLKAMLADPAMPRDLRIFAPCTVTKDGQNPLTHEKSLLQLDWSTRRLRPYSVSTGWIDTQLDWTPQSPQPSHTSSLMMTRLSGSG